MTLSTCPECGAAWPDYISPRGSTGVLCLDCGYSSDDSTPCTDRHRPDEEPEA